MNVKRHASYLTGGVLLNDVVELRWLDKPMGGTARETYFYARGYGLVAFAGFATLTYDSTGTPVVSLERTTMLTNTLGAPITGGEAVQYPYTTQYIIEAMRTYCQTAYARVKLVDDGARISEGIAAVTPLEVKGDLGTLADEWEAAALIESAAQFKAGLIVERNSTNRNRLDIYAGPDLANQLRVIAVRVVPVI